MAGGASRIRGLDLLPVVFCTLVFLLAYGAGRAGSVMIVEDSPSYIEFLSIRTGGYPAFLAVTQWLGMSLPMVCLLQAFLYAISTVWLSLEVLALTRCRSVAMATSVILWVLPPLAAFHFQIATESLFLSLETVLLALLLRIVRKKDAASFLCLCATAGIATVLRPVGAALLPILPIMLVWCYRDARLKKAGGIAITGLLIVLGLFAAERSYYHLVHGPHRASLMGLHLFAKAALVRTQGPFDQTALAQLSRPARELFERLGADSEPVRAVVWSPASQDVREHFVNAYEAYYQYAFHDAASREMFREGLCADPWCSDVLLKLGLIRLQEAPIDYLRLTAIHYFGLWSVYGVRTSAGTAAAQTFEDAHRPLPLSAGIEKFNQKAAPLWYAWPVKIGVAGMGVLSCLAFTGLIVGLVVFKAVHPYLAISGLCAMLVHGNLLGVAMTGVSITRYTIATWPMLLISMVFLVLYLAGCALGHFRAGQSDDQRGETARNGATD